MILARSPVGCSSMDLCNSILKCLCSAALNLSGLAHRVTYRTMCLASAPGSVTTSSTSAATGMRRGMKFSGSSIESGPKTDAMTLDFPDPLGPTTATRPRFPTRRHRVDSVFLSPFSSSNATW